VSQVAGLISRDELWRSLTYLIRAHGHNRQADRKDYYVNTVLCTSASCSKNHKMCLTKLKSPHTYYDRTVLHRHCTRL